MNFFLFTNLVHLWVFLRDKIHIMQNETSQLVEYVCTLPDRNYCITLI